MPELLFQSLIKIIIILVLAFGVTKVINYFFPSVPSWVSTLVYAVAGIAVLYVLFDIMKAVL